MISNTNEIDNYTHCALCIEELETGEYEYSPRDYARTEIGFTSIGLQVWCIRHECNIMHIDFEGNCHPSNETRINFPKLKVAK